MDGSLKVNADGSFSTLNAIVVEAHKIDATDPSNPIADAELYDGDVNWSLVAPNISNSSYVASDIKFLLNGADLAVGGSPVSTQAGNHVVSVATSYSDPASVVPGETLMVSALIMASPI